MNYRKHPELKGLSRKEYGYQWLKNKREEDKKPDIICPCCGKIIYDHEMKNNEMKEVIMELSKFGAHKLLEMLNKEIINT